MSVKSPCVSPSALLAGRLIAQLLTESALIAVIGAALALGLAAVLSRVPGGGDLVSESQPISLVLASDWRIFAVRDRPGDPDLRHRSASCRRSGPLGAAPADAMKSGARGSTDGRERYALQRLLVVGQIAVSLVLLVGAALFVRSFYNLVTFDPASASTGIGVVFVNFSASRSRPSGACRSSRTSSPRSSGCLASRTPPRRRSSP